MVSLQAKLVEFLLIGICLTVKYVIMAIAIKAIPTLYGEEATRFRMAMEMAEAEYDAREKQDIKADPMYAAMKRMLERSGLK